MTRNVKRETARLASFDSSALDLRDAIERVLRLPSVANKTFLISIGDRTVGGMTRVTRWSARGRCRWRTSRSR